MGVISVDPREGRNLPELSGKLDAFMYKRSLSVRWKIRAGIFRFHGYIGFREFGVRRLVTATVSRNWMVRDLLEFIGKRKVGVSREVIGVWKNWDLPEFIIDPRISQKIREFFREFVKKWEFLLFLLRYHVDAFYQNQLTCTKRSLISSIVMFLY